MKGLIALIIFVVAYILLRQHNYKDALVCPITQYLMWYTLCLFLAWLRLDGKNELSFENMSMNFISIIIVFLTFQFVMRVKSSVMYETEYVRAPIKISNTVLYIVAIISFGYSVYQFLNGTALLYLSGLSAAEIRGEYLVNGSVFDSPMSYIIDEIFNGIRIVLMIIVTQRTLKGEIKSPFLMGLVVINVAIRSFVGSDRLFLFDFCFILLISFINLGADQLSEELLYKIKKNRRYIVGAAIIIGFIAVYFTRERQESISIANALFGNISCGFQIFDVVKPKMDISGVQTMGITSLDGIFIIINCILAFLGLPQIENINEINKYDVPFWNIGGENYFNGYMPYVSYFYLDGCWIGVVVGSIALGVFFASVYKRFIYRKNDWDIFMYYMCVLVIVRTSLRFYFSRADFIWAIIIGAILFKSHRAITIGNRRIL